MQRLTTERDNSATANGRIEQLTGADAVFLYLETPTHFHQGCGLLFLDTSTMEGGYSFEKIRSWLVERTAVIPTYAEVAFKPWYNLGHPVWVADESFDLDRHVIHRTLPAPGTDAELLQACSEIAGAPLDLTAPLWEMTIIDGIADGRVAVMIKRHNASLDGVQGNTQLGQLCGNEAAEHAIVRRAGQANARAIALLGLKSFLLKPFKMLGILGRTAVGTLSGKRPSLPEGVPKPLSAPRTSLNTTLTENRNVAFTTLPLPAALDLKNRLGVTLNDLVLALSATVLRNYLADRGELPDEPLQAFAPMAVHHQRGMHGRNQITGLLTSLQTQVADPYRRAMEIAQITKRCKEYAVAMGPGALHEYFELAAPYWGRMFRWYSRRRLADRHGVMQSLVVSNMGGRHRELYFAGARITHFYPFGAPLDGAVLFIGVATYDDQLNFGLIACPEILPDLTGLADGFAPAFAELASVEAVGGEPAAGEMGD